MGDHEDFERVYRAHYALVVAYVRRRVSDPAVVDDVVAETFLAAWRHLDDLADTPLPWLYRAAHLSLGTNRRSTARRHGLTDRLAGQPPADARDHADDVARRIAVAEALDGLSPGDQEVLRLRHWEDLDITALATALDCSTTAARVRLHRARRRLARLLTTHPPDPSTEDSRKEPDHAPA